MLKINREELVIQAAVGEISHPATKGSPYRINPEGRPLALPSVGSICYNVKVGDNIRAFAGDHIEPGVSLRNREKPFGVFDPMFGFTFLSCIGNKAKVITGDAKGDEGFVFGKHGGIEHVLVQFPDDTLEKLVLGDKVQVRTIGQGMKIIDLPDVTIMNIDPDLVNKINFQIENGKIKAPVTHLVPAKVMGSGLGKDNTYIGDYDIQMFDESVVREFKLDTMRFGDLVAITDADHTFGRIWREGAISLGFIVHSDCTTAGHGPGFTTIMTSKDGLIEPVITPDANLLKWV